MFLSYNCLYLSRIITHYQVDFVSPRLGCCQFYDNVSLSRGPPHILQADLVVHRICCFQISENVIMSPHILQVDFLLCRLGFSNSKGMWLCSKDHCTFCRSPFYNVSHWLFDGVALAMFNCAAMSLFPQGDHTCCKLTLYCVALLLSLLRTCDYLQGLTIHLASRVFITSPYFLIASPWWLNNIDKA